MKIKMNKLKNSLKTFGKFFKKNKSTFAIAGGVIASGYGTYSLVKNAPKVAGDLKEAESEKGSPLTFWEKTCVVMPKYAPGIITWVTGNGLIITGHIMDKKTQASLASAVALAQHKYHEYRQTNIEENGKEADQRVLQKITNRRWQKSKTMVCDDHSDQILFYDQCTETFFISTYEDVKDAIHKLDIHLWSDGMVPYDDFLADLGIPGAAKDEMYFDQYVLEACWGVYCWSGVDQGPLRIGPEMTLDDGTKYVPIMYDGMPENADELEEDLRSCGIESEDHPSKQVRDAIEKDDWNDERQGLA